MGFDTTGFVLRAPRTAPGNATSTGAATDGVLRDVRNLPGSYDMPGNLVEVSADQYRAAVLLSPNGLESQEFLVWAANSSSLTVLETPDWTTTALVPRETVLIPQGTITAGVFSDATDRLVVTDTGGRGIAQVRLIRIVRGDNSVEVSCGPDAPTDFASQDADAGVVVLDAATLSALGGGVSTLRGDTIVRADYIVAAARFWWTRNDVNVTRFGWNGKAQRWEAYKGGSPKNLGALAAGTEYILTPRPSRFSVGDTLPGNPAAPDSYALVRVGVYPDKDSAVPEILVVADSVVKAGYSFTGPTPDAVIGVTNGLIQFNDQPGAFLDTNTGRTVWYSRESYSEDSDGALGALITATDIPLFLSPVPGATDRPFVRLGFRRYLTPRSAENDADLISLTVGAGEFGWSKTTGKIKLNTLDVLKANPDDAGFDIRYLGCQVYYDGVSLTTRSLSTRAPQQLIDSSGNPDTVGAANKLYIPRSAPAPFPGVSGVLQVPDGTGTLPNTTTTPTYRPHGSGLLRQIEGVGDTILFGPAGAIETIEIVELESDLPDFPFLIRKGKAWVATEPTTTGATGSRVSLGLKDRVRFGGQTMYFLQADVQPAVYTDEARIYSRQQEPFTLEGSELLAFAIDGTPVLWNASALGVGDHLAADVAASMDAARVSAGATGQVSALNGRIFIRGASLSSGSVEIGWGTLVSPHAYLDRDLSGSGALGFLPGWRAVGGVDNWLPDHGATLGVFRSPQNLDRSKTTPDIKARASFTGTVLTDNLIASPYFNLDFPPLQDVAGYDDDLFFLLVDGFNFKLLGNLVNVLYDFGNSRIAWLDQETGAGGRIEQATNALGLGNPGVVADTLHPAVAQGNGLYVAETGGVLTRLTEGVDFLLPSNGAPGLAYLTEVFGGQVDIGGAGSFTAGGTTFTDPNASFITDNVAAGYRLKIQSGDSEGSYVVASVTTEQTLEIDAAATGTFLSTESYASWRLFTGFETTVYDPGVVADVQYVQFNHLPSEPFKVRALSSTGTVPTNDAAQRPPTGTRNVAVMTDALKRGRPINMRVGLAAGSPELQLTPLRRTNLGDVANGTLFVPNLADPHFTNNNFDIRVGSKLYTQDYPLTGDGPLTGVAAFGPLSGDEAEYLLSTGELGFGATTLSELESSTVYYVQAFLVASALAAGTVEYQRGTGDLNFSASDMASYAGTVAYFVEQMITEDRLDVALSPFNGSFYFNKPLREGQVVETSYFQADSQQARSTDSDGNPLPEITEFLPLFVRQEVATRINSRIYSINANGKTIRGDITPQIWAGINLQNYAGRREASINSDTSLVSFTHDIAAADEVLVNYAVLEAFGGEQTYTTSTTPVYRPPFFLPANQGLITLATDRTVDMVPGKLLRVGASPFYIQSATYSAGPDETQVRVFPTPLGEVGTRAPGNDVLTLLSDRVVTTDVGGTPTAGDPGFLLPLAATYEPADTGMLSLTFQGDVTLFAIAGHLLELGGYPFIIAGSTLSDDGLTTQVDLTSPLPKGFEPLTDAVKISVRPIYPPQPTEFLGVNPLVETEETELVLFGREDSNGDPLPGRTLLPNIEYVLDPSTGAINFVTPPQEALQPRQKLLLSYTKQKILAPFLDNGVLGFPRFKAKYGFVTTPTDTNGLLGTTLAARYTYRNPDSFYYRAVPIQTYMGEVAEVAIQRLSSSSAGGPMSTALGSPSNFSRGNQSLAAQRSNLVDQDRAARTFVSLYNEVVVSFEQIKEAISGEVVGDHDGKFKFFVGRGKAYTPPGYEDAITGVLNPRNIWADVFLAANGSIRVGFLDPIWDPETATQDPTTLETDGDFMNPDLMGFYLKFQKDLVYNDMDDFVLIRRLRPRMAKKSGLPRMRGLGDYQQMWEPHRFSRLFPEEALAFTTTYPGLLSDLANNDPGVYSFRKMLEPPKIFKGDSAVYGSTFKQPIGSLSNPAIGVLANVTDAEVRDRLPRARVWGYSETGYPDLGGPAVPSVIATPLFLKDFPIDRNTGLPDITRLISNGGDLADLNTGDQELSTASWKAYNRDKSIGPRVMQQVSIGRPTGETLGLGDANKELKTLFGLTDLFDKPRYGGVFVFDIYAGCILTFTDGASFLSPSGQTEITDPNQILMLGSGDLEGTPLALAQGDTIYVGPPDGTDSDADLADAQNNIDTQDEIAEGKPTYRRGFDIGVRKTGGDFLDLSLPSIKDPAFPLKEFTGQKGPDPLTTIEAAVEFTNVSRDPFEFPALLGEPTNDSGDYAIPYLSFGSTELDRLSSVVDTFTAIESTDSPAPGAVYPNEIVGADGLVVAAWDGVNPPATLITTRDLEPTGGSYTAGSGDGDIAPGDLLLIEAGQSGVVAGAQGVLTVGAVDALAGTMEPPRFVTASRLGDRFRYHLNRAMAHLNGGGTSGAVVDDDGVTTTLNISSLAGLVFNDGTVGAPTGGLNNIINNALFAFPNDNVILIVIRDNVTGAPLESIQIGPSGAVPGTIDVTASLGTVSTAVLPTFTDDTITLGGVTGIVNPAVLGGGFPTGPFDFTLAIDTYNGGVLAGVSTGLIQTDHLTFQETLDLRTAPARGTTLGTGAFPVEAELRVWRVTGDASDDIAVNDITEVNGGAFLTFLPRDGTGAVGTFSAGVGTLRAMAFEGQGNVPLSSAGVLFSAVPSSSQNTAGFICVGSTTTEDGSNFLSGDTTLPSWSIAGSLSNIEPGDIMLIDGGAGTPQRAAVKTGTYLIRHALPEAAEPITPRTLYEPGSHEVLETVNTLSGAGTWTDVTFPRVESVTHSTGPTVFELVVDRIPSVPTSPNGYGFQNTGTLWIIDSTQDLDTALGVDYLSFTVDPETGRATFVLSSGTAQDGSGTPVTDAVFAAGARRRAKVAGMTYFSVGQFRAGLPANNTVGSASYDNGAGTTLGGFIGIKINNDRATGGIRNFDVGSSLVDSTTVTPSGGDLGVAVSDAPGGTYTLDPKSFPSGTSRESFVYEGVPMHLDFRGLGAGKWNTIHGATGTAIRTLVPGDLLTTEDTAGEPGFLAQSGIFIEPSFPTTVQDLNDGNPKVVDIARTMTGQMGMRDYGAFAVGTSEDVHYIVKRIRRFHDVMDGIGNNLGPLRHAYEIRRGTVGIYDVSTPSLPSLAAVSPATQLGPFNLAAVNINAGDTVRILNSSGSVVDEAEILVVVDEKKVILAPPGFAQNPPTGGESFEVYLRQAPVPHEQSNEQLLELITDQVIFEQAAVPNTAGGKATDWNELRDADGAVNFGPAGIGVQQGDIVIIDSAGTLVGPGGATTPPELGSRPIGDQAVPSRSTDVPSPFIAGLPSELDDNRGFYRVDEVDPAAGAYLKLIPGNEYAGPVGSNVVFGAPAPTNQEFALYPTISASGLEWPPTSGNFGNPAGATGEEGQNDLRPTAVADGGDSYKGNRYSIEPFSYRVIRPSGLFSEDAIDLILTTRERMLSWIEEMQGSSAGQKQGDYYVFQRDEHITDLGSPTDPDDGLGVASNLYVTSMAGLTAYAPYANTSDGLSVLGRRFWIFDTRLDNEGPSGDPDTYASLEMDNSASGYTVGSGRPVLPERVDGVLDRIDRFRNMRYAWIKFRADRVNGSLPAIERFDQELPRKIQEQEDLLRLQEGLDEA